VKDSLMVANFALAYFLHNLNFFLNPTANVVTKHKIFQINLSFFIALDRDRNLECGPRGHENPLFS
jgi:hypothetical protein